MCVCVCVIYPWLFFVSSSNPDMTDYIKTKDAITQHLALLSEDEKTSAGFSSDQLIIDSMYAGYPVPLR